MIFLVVLLCFCVQCSIAGFERHDAGGKNAALGGAFLPVTDDFWAVRGNPAGLSRILHSTIGVDYTPDPFGVAELRSYNADVAVPAGFGNVGLAIGGFGFTLYREISVSFACARTFHGIDAGLRANCHSVAIGGYGTSSSFSFDAGLLVPVFPSVTIGIVLSNPTGASIGISRERLPQSFALGVMVSPSVDTRLYGAYHKELGFDASPRFAFEYIAFKRLALRGGIAAEPATASAGIGFEWEDLRFDYAATCHDELSWTQEFSLVFSWGGGHD